MSIVVSDTSPIRALHHLELMEILRHLYGAVLVPPTVESELAQPPMGLPGIDVRSFSFITIRAPTDVQHVQRLLEELDAGEAEAIALAIELKPATLLIDESAGRAVAAAAGIPHIGVLGILALAKRQGLIDRCRPIIDRLRTELKFRIGDRLYDEYMRSVAE